MASITIRINLNENLYLKDPQETKLGRNIIEHSINMIHLMGFENFTFKKLATEISSTEASVYRYFENKHMLLIYLVSWYWEWVRFQISWRTMNISGPQSKLEMAIDTLVESSHQSNLIEFVNESVLHQIVIAEGSKAYHTIDVDKENKKGLFTSYKDLVEEISELIINLNKDFPYPHTLASNLVEMANNQLFFAEHLPSLCDITSAEKSGDELIRIMKFFAFKLLRA